MLNLMTELKMQKLGKFLNKYLNFISVDYSIYWYEIDNQ